MSQHLVLSIDSNITVANVSALSLVGDGYIPNGAGYFVASLMSIFQLNKAGTDVADGITVALTLSGVGRWYRVKGCSSYWQNYTDFYIDPVTGNDENMGTVVAPLKTWKELRRRWEILLIME